MPIHDGLESDRIWGAESVLPRDIHNGMEDNQWSYWGGNPIQGKDGRYHIAICRWKEEASYMGWRRSEVAHCVSDHPTGPYSVTKTIVEKRHNPEVIQLSSGTYVLHVYGGRLYTSDFLSGPWIEQRKMTVDVRGFIGASGLSNLTGLEREDGSLLFLTKRGNIMISNTGLLGPYKLVSVRNYTRYSGYPEDPVIWKSRHQYHAIYNHAIDRKSFYMRSLDGIHWQNDVGQPYDADIFRYTDGTKNTWYKFERPKVLQDELDRATHLSLAVIDVPKNDDLGDDRHSSENVIMPLVTEKLVTILNEEPIGETMYHVELRIMAESGLGVTAMPPIVNGEAEL